MQNFFLSIGFHRSGKPRGWLRLVLFRNGWVVRPLFKRVVHKKSGLIRPRFAYWIKASSNLSTESQTPAQSAPLRQEELVLQNLTPLNVKVKHWLGRDNPATLLDKTALIARISQSVQPSILIAVGQDNYRKVQGGVQLCIQREEMMAAEHGFSYLQIHPWHPLPRLAHHAKDPDCIVAAIYDGTEIGACHMSELTAAVRALATSRSHNVAVVVHHMMGHQPEQISDLILATGSKRCVFWLHDFFSICPSYTLQRNTLAFCNAPDVASNACFLCLYGKERHVHRERMKAFFETITVDIASPSDVTAAFWQAKSGLNAASVTVIPHISLAVTPKPAAAASTPKKITVGYLGAPVQHKGWSAFTNLMHMHAGFSDYRFVVMSDKQPRLGEDVWVPVSVTAKTPSAMSDAVAQAEVDIVLHWPSWPETFSFTTFEALAGSAYLLTNPGSGNVAAAVKVTGRGKILCNEADLLAFFQDGRAQEMAKQRRADRETTEISVQHSRMSYSLLEKVQ